MKKILFISIVLLCSAGCQSLVEKEDGVKSFFSSTQPIAEAADPVTGGMASIIWGSLGTAAGALLSINRAMVASRRKKVIVEANDSEHSPDIRKQVTSEIARRTVSKLCTPKEL